VTSVGRSTTPVSGSREVTMQRPISPLKTTRRLADPHLDTHPPILLVGFDAVDLKQHPEAPPVDLIRDTCLLAQPLPAMRATSWRTWSPVPPAKFSFH